jgi:deoxycytidine triphosphate deaminase
MTLIAGEELDAAQFFRSGSPKRRASSFDLTIGEIIDHAGEASFGPFKLQPGHMVQVISKEVFSLPADVTGHVTYKTALTRNGIWALTVGIIDPGWRGPISTTLFNFSKSDYAIHEGDSFLRVSFFKHAAVNETHFPKQYDSVAYRIEIRKIAMTKFAETFLNQDEISEKAGKAVISRIQLQSLAWVALIATVFTIAQIIIDAWFNWKPSDNEDVKQLKQEIQRIDAELARKTSCQTTASGRYIKMRVALL